MGTSITQHRNTYGGTVTGMGPETGLMMRSLASPATAKSAAGFAMAVATRLARDWCQVARSFTYLAAITPLALLARTRFPLW